MSYDVGELVASIQMDVDDMQRQLDSAVKIFGRMGAGMDKLNEATVRTEKQFKDMGDSIKMSTVRMMQGFNNVEVAIDKLPHAFRDLTTASQQTARVLSSVVAPQLQTLINQMSRLNAASLQAGQGMRQGLGGLGSAFSSAGSSGYAFTDGLLGKLREVTTNIFFVQMAVEQLGSIFKTVFGQGVMFAANMETTLIGLAGVISSTMKYADTGEDVPFATGMKLAEKTLSDMKVEALKTTATLEELMKVFQGILAPATALGMTMKEIKDFTVFGSTAVKSMGLKDDQLVQELRAILTGNITARSATVATSLGITNEMITEAKTKAGGVFKFLQDRFSGFQAAVNATGSTLTAIWTNIMDGIQQTQEKAFIGLFAGLKSELAKLQGLFIVVKKEIVDVVDEFGQLTGEKREISSVSLNEDTVRKFKALADITAQVYNDLKNWAIKLSENDDFMRKLNSSWETTQRIIKDVYDNFENIGKTLLLVWGFSGGLTRAIIVLVGYFRGIDELLGFIERKWPLILAGITLVSVATSGWLGKLVKISAGLGTLAETMPALAIALRSPWLALIAVIGTAILALQDFDQASKRAAETTEERMARRRREMWEEQQRRGVQGPSPKPASYLAPRDTEDMYGNGPGAYQRLPSVETDEMRKTTAKYEEEDKKANKQAHKDAVAEIRAQMAEEIQIVKEAQAAMLDIKERNGMSAIAYNKFIMDSDVRLALREVELYKQQSELAETAADKSKLRAEAEQKLSDLRIKVTKAGTAIYNEAIDAMSKSHDAQIEIYRSQGDFASAYEMQIMQSQLKNRALYTSIKEIDTVMASFTADLAKNQALLDTAMKTPGADKGTVATLEAMVKASKVAVDAIGTMKDSLENQAKAVELYNQRLKDKEILDAADLEITLAMAPINRERIALSKQIADGILSEVDAQNKKNALDQQEANIINTIKIPALRRVKAEQASSGRSAEAATTEAQINSASQQVSDLGDRMDEESKRIRASVKSNLEDAFVDVITGTKNVANAFKDMANAILKDIVKLMVNKWVTQFVNAFMGGGSTVAQPASSFTGVYKGLGSYSSGLKFASGGYISGPGTPTSDSIPALLSNGEFVLRASAVSRLGREALEYINAYGSLPRLRFASGGAVGNVAMAGAGGGLGNLKIEVINQTGQNVQASVNNVSINPMETVIQMVIAGVQQNTLGIGEMLKRR